jgi:hypothetical protein
MEQKQPTSILQEINTKDTYMLIGGIVLISSGVYCMTNGGISAIQKCVKSLTG